MSINKINTSLIFGGLSLLFVILPAFVKSQSSLNPDSIFHGTSSAPWFPDGTNLISVQGNIFVITYKQNYPDTRAYGVYVYTIDNKGNLEPYTMGSNKLNSFYYGFPLEGTYYEGIQGNSIAFLYNGQLWHYINQMEDGSILDPAKDSYDCFAMVPLPKTGQPRTYYNLITGSPSVIKKGAFQHDSTLYFFGVYNNSKDPNYKKWCLQKYTYNKSQNKFSYSSTIPVTNIPGDHFGGYVEHIDSAGRHRLIINTYTQNSIMSAVGYLDATTSGNQTTFTYTNNPFAVTPPAYASVIVGGSIKGCRTPAQVPLQNCPERFAIFGIASGHIMKYCEYLYWEGEMALGSSGSIVLPSSMDPYSVGSKYNIQGTFELIPKMFHTNVNHSPDGFRQNNWIYYPDKNQKICGARFLSDSWQFIPDSTVSSNDLSNDSIYGPKVRSLWTLTGIVDGAPPCSINWPVWKDPAHHPSNMFPTDLKFVQTNVSKTEVTTISEDQYTIGGEFKTDFKLINFGLETKFSETFKNKVSKSTTIIKEITKTFELNPDGQNLGYYIYSVPAITRYKYHVFPWYDNVLSNPVPHTVQYRYVVTGIALLNRNRELKEFPFLINNPNAVNMAEWKNSGRIHHQNAIMMSGLMPVYTSTWTSPNPGEIGSFEKITDSITEYEHKTAYSISASFTGKKPEVFEVGVSAGLDLSYTTSTKNMTELGTKLEISLMNLTEAALGVNFSELVLETYWFKPEDYKWWYYDSLGTERPWYIAYIVDHARGKVNLTTPGANEDIKGNSQLFSWQADGFKPKKCTLFLSTSPHITPSSTIMKIDAGTVTDYFIPNMPPDIGKLFWAVMAVTEEGDIVWSESRPLLIQKENPGNSPAGNLIAIPYPNPIRNDGLHLLLDTGEKGNVNFQILSFNGIKIYESNRDHAAEGSWTYEFTGLNLPHGFYLMVVTINGQRIVKKLTVE